MRAILRNRKLVGALVLVLVLGGAAVALSKPSRRPRMKVTGTIYVLPQSFLLNLTEGHYAKLSVALDLAPQQSDGAGATPPPSGSGEAPGTLPEEALVREIVVNAVTGQRGEALVSANARHEIQRRILAAIRRETDLKVQSVLLPEVTVQ